MFSMAVLKASDSASMPIDSASSWWVLVLLVV